MKNLPISIQTFENIIKGEMIYVDKTKFIYPLVNKGKYFFLARPRRFGKSLVLTTLKAFFQGKKELFKGLYIYDKIEDWTVYPVIHIDYSKVEYRDTKAIFISSMLAHLQAIGYDYQVTLTQETISAAFNELVLKLHEKYQQKVVVLVDEYDKPLVDSLTNPAEFNRNRIILSSLYGTMKGHDDYLRFVMLTGVSRFSKVSIFSGMNNLTDISQNAAFSTIVGFTQAELEHYFSDYIETVSYTHLTLPTTPYV